MKTYCEFIRDKDVAAFTGGVDGNSTVTPFICTFTVAAFTGGVDGNTSYFG